MKIMDHGCMQPSKRLTAVTTMGYPILSVENRQIDNAEHKKHIQHPNNCKAVPPGTDRKGTIQLENMLMKTIPTQHDRMLKSYTADSQIHMAYNDRQEESDSNTSNGNRWEKSGHITPTQWN